MKLIRDISNEMTSNTSKERPFMNGNISYAPLLDDIQGNILKSHNREYATLLFLKIKQEEIKNFKKVVATKYSKLVKQSNFSSLLSTNDENHLITFYGFYIGTNGYIKLSNKQTGFTKVDHTTNDILLIIADNNQSILNTMVKEVKDLFRSSTELIHTEDGKKTKKTFNPSNKPHDVDHFGFTDGISQPCFFEEDKPNKRDKWDPSANFSLVLKKDDNSPINGYGSFLAFQKFIQHTDSWQSIIGKKATELAENAILKHKNENPSEVLEEWVIGRKKDGTPLIDEDGPNNFNYDKDIDGFKCPLHSHIRKCNPRGGSFKEEEGKKKPINESRFKEEEKKRRIARRSITYNNGSEKGLLFMCFQNSIENQFKFIINNWINVTANFTKSKRGTTGYDQLIGKINDTAKSFWPIKGKSYLDKETQFSLHKNDNKFITPKDHMEFFAPSISAIEHIESWESTKNFFDKFLKK